MSRWWRADAVAIHAQAYQRSPLEPRPAERTSQRRLSFSSRADGLRAGQLRARGQGEGEVRRHAQYVRLAVVLEELAQLGAAAIDLVAAGEIEAEAVGVHLRAQVDGQLPLGAELQIRRQAHGQGLHRIVDVLGRYPLAGADQRVPGLFPHVRQVHGVDPVGHPARASHVLAFDSRGRLAGFLLPGLVDRCDHQAAAPGGRAALPPPGLWPRTGAPRSSRRTCPRPRGSAAAASDPASGPRRAGRCSTRSPGAAR